jgi:uncharacterized protein (TIGR03435 family)
MKRILLLAATLFAVLPVESQTSSPAKPIVFAVSTVKPAVSTGGNISFLFTPYGLSIKNITLESVIRNAYQLQDDQLLNTPAWARNVRYDIEAKVDDEDREALKRLTRQERAAMVQALLADRFHLKTHPDTRELSVFHLVVAKGGVKMTSTPPPPAGEEGKRRNQGILGSRGELKGTNCPTEVLVQVLSNVTHHLVVDKTGLTDHYDFKITFTDDNTPASAESTAPSIYTALQEQLGLKLESGKAQMPVMVVDQIDQPTAD